LVTNKLYKHSLSAGLIVGLGFAIYFMEIVNHFSTWKTTLIVTNSELGPFFIGFFALIANLITSSVKTHLFRGGMRANRNLNNTNVFT
jgi:hypothetical protein